MQMTSSEGLRREKIERQRDLSLQGQMAEIDEAERQRQAEREWREKHPTLWMKCVSAGAAGWFVWSVGQSFWGEYDKTVLVFMVVIGCLVPIVNELERLRQRANKEDQQ
jgi:hypothetical protein